MKLTFVMVLALGAVCLSAQKPTDAGRAAVLVVRWQQIVYPKFEGARAFIGDYLTRRGDSGFLKGAMSSAVSNPRASLLISLVLISVGLGVPTCSG